MEKDVDDLELFARDLDGTGSMHLCDADADGATRFVREDQHLSLSNSILEMDREMQEGSPTVATIMLASLVAKINNS